MSGSLVPACIVQGGHVRLCGTVRSQPTLWHDGVMGGGR
jgi:hypothetical protein